MSFLKELAISIPIIIIVAILSSQLIVVPTESMSPVINAGDIVLVEKTNVLDIFSELDPSEVQVGDIIIYEIPKKAHEENNEVESEENIIHRVISVKKSKDKNYLILKGDNNIHTDKERVYLSQVKGRVITWNGKPILIPKIGFLIYYVKDLIRM